MPGWINSLSAKLIQLTAPGVPDVYQGSELWETSLVDPDNRRPVDFDRRRRLLAELDAGTLPPIDETGAAKLLVTSRALRLRRDHPELFTPLRAAAGVRIRRRGTPSRSTGVRSSPSPPGCPIGLGAVGRLGRHRRSCSPAVPSPTSSPAASSTAARSHLADLLDRYPVALLAPAERAPQ